MQELNNFFLGICFQEQNHFGFIFIFGVFVRDYK